MRAHVARLDAVSSRRPIYPYWHQTAEPEACYASGLIYCSAEYISARSVIAVETRMVDRRHHWPAGTIFVLYLRVCNSG